MPTWVRRLARLAPTLIHLHYPQTQKKELFDPESASEKPRLFPFQYISIKFYKYIFDSCAQYRYASELNLCCRAKHLTSKSTDISVPPKSWRYRQKVGGTAKMLMFCRNFFDLPESANFFAGIRCRNKWFPSNEHRQLFAGAGIRYRNEWP